MQVNLFGIQPIPQVLARAQTLEEIKENRPPPDPEFPHIYLGQDTRESSPVIADIVMKGLEALRVPYTDFGQIPTPMLHYMVANHQVNHPTPQHYFDHISRNFCEFMQLSTALDRKYERRIVIDCSNGVSALHLPELATRVQQFLKIDLINVRTDAKDKLNFECGAEYVSNKVRFPTEVPAAGTEKMASLDGDGDRLIYFRKASKVPQIINGDK